VRVLRNHGEKTKSNHTVVGYCMRLDNLQAAFLLVKLKHLEDWNHARRVSPSLRPASGGHRGHHARYRRPDVEAVYHLYVVQWTIGSR